MAHGITNKMRNIRRRSAPEWVVQHKGQNRAERRHYRPYQNLQVIGRERGRNYITGGITWPKNLRDPAINATYVNPERDLRKGRHLR